MNAGMADRRGSTLCSGATRTTFEAISPTLTRRCAAVHPPRKRGVALRLGLTAVFALGIGQACAQDAGMLDGRVTQQSVGETICLPGYADTVAPPSDELMAHKDRMLAARGIDAGSGVAFALDRRVPIVLGGSPDAPSNLDLLPW